MRKVTREVTFRTVFHAPSRKFEILAIPKVLAHVKTYEPCFAKKCDGRKFCAKSRAKSSFDRFSFNVSEIKNTGHTPSISPWEVVRARFHEKCDAKFRSVFHGPSWKFEILAIPNVFTHVKSYEHGFTKKCDGYKLCAKLNFDWVFVHRLGNLKYYHFQCISSWEVVRARLVKKCDGQKL
ncbi:hypothetical protein BHE74_00039267 [Ensete ventricosum]|nr:hypothetical protein BHE74_00039267 [Ensete ventricosum]